MTAIASPRTQLKENVTEQIDAWDNIAKNGRLGVTVARGKKGHPKAGSSEFVLHGASTGVKALHYDRLNRLLDKYGSMEAVVELILSDMPVAALRKYPTTLGAGEVGGTQVKQIKDTVEVATGQSEKIPVAFIFGPKVGAYILNHLGRFEYTTGDVWESRFWRSYFSDVPAATGTEEDTAARQLFQTTSRKMAAKLGLSPAAVQAVRWYYMIDIARTSGYGRAQSNETIAEHTRREVEKRSAVGKEGSKPNRSGKNAKPGGNRKGRKGSDGRSTRGAKAS